MDLIQYMHRPTVASGVAFDGTLQSAQWIQEWVQSGSGMAVAIAPVRGATYMLYVPSPSGTVAVVAGDIVLQSSPTTYYPITPEALAQNYFPPPEPTVPEDPPVIP